MLRVEGLIKKSVFIRVHPWLNTLLAVQRVELNSFARTSNRADHFTNQIGGSVRQSNASVCFAARLNSKFKMLKPSHTPKASLRVKVLREVENAHGASSEVGRIAPIAAAQ
jgi:hypothetical protein